MKGKKEKKEKREKKKENRKNKERERERERERETRRTRDRFPVHGTTVESHLGGPRVSCTLGLLPSPSSSSFSSSSFSSPLSAVRPPR